MKNYYDLLGIKKNASLEEIQEAINLNKNNIEPNLLSRISMTLLSASEKESYDKSLNADYKIEAIKGTSDNISLLNQNQDNSDESANQEKSDKSFNIRSIKNPKEKLESFDFLSKHVNDADFDASDKESFDESKNESHDDKKEESDFNIHQNDYIIKIHCIGFLIIAILNCATKIGYDPTAPITTLEGVSALLSLAFLIFSIYVLVREFNFLPKIKMHRAFFIAFILVTPVYYLQRTSITKTLKLEAIATLLGFAINIASNAYFS